jgi:hypothetical protein
MVNAPPAPPNAAPTVGPASDSSGGSGVTNGASGGPAPGELGITERRSWHTWQLVVFGVACLLLGMLITWSGNSGATQGSTGSSTGSNYKLPPPAGTSATTAPGAASATTQPPATSGATSPPSSAVTTTTTPGSPQVLLGPTAETHGSWTSSAFTVGSGTWSIGWAFRCTPAPASGPSFQVFVVPSGGKPGTTPAVNETGASGQSITSQTSVGSQELQVTAPTSCVWLVKVTGVP